MPAKGEKSTNRADIDESTGRSSKKPVRTPFNAVSPPRIVVSTPALFPLCEKCGLVVREATQAISLAGLTSFFPVLIN